MWTTVIITLFLAGFIFYFFASYHRSIENKDFSSESSASTEFQLDQQNANKIITKLKIYFKPLRNYWKLKWKKFNRKKKFFKKYKAAYINKKWSFKSDFQYRLNHFFSSTETETVSRGLYIFEKIDSSILYTYGMFVIVSLPKVPSVWSIRMFTGWWWLYCILLSVAYKASMTAILASPAPR